MQKISDILEFSLCNKGLDVNYYLIAKFDNSSVTY